MTTPLPSSCHGASLSAFLFYFRAAGSRRPEARRSSSQRPRRPATAVHPGRHFGLHRLGCNLPPPWQTFPSARTTGATPQPTARASAAVNSIAGEVHFQVCFKIPANRYFTTNVAQPSWSVPHRTAPADPEFESPSAQRAPFYFFPTLTARTHSSATAEQACARQRPVSILGPAVSD